MRIYPTKPDIPPYQRDWVWGTAALAILACGLLAGWLLKPGQPDYRSLGSPAAPVIRPADSDQRLARQAAENQELRARIAELEQALTGDVCGTAPTASGNR